MLHSDSPIITADEDLLGRGAFASHLARYLHQTAKGRSSVIALCGKWGSGKTSLKNMAVQELKRQKNPPIIIDYNPWSCASVDRLIPDFLHALRAGLSKSLTTEKARSAVGGVFRAIDSYASILAPFDVAVQWTGLPFSANVASSASRALYSKLMNDDDVQSCKKKVSEELELSFENVIVVIDDIDRLPNDKICLLFQLVAQIADFSHVHYLLVYDNEVVERAICELQDSRGREYLEKVVQLSIDVPELPRSVIYEHVHYFLDQYFDSRNIDEAGVEALRANEMVDVAVVGTIDTMRDYKRFCNAFEFEELYVNDGMSIVDLVGVVAIKQAYPKALSWMDANVDTLCGAGAMSYVVDEAVKFKETKVRELADVPGFSLEDAERIVGILELLFPRFASFCGRLDELKTEQELRMEGRIASEDIYLNYRRSSLVSWDYPREIIRILLESGSREDIANVLDGDFSSGFGFAHEAEGLVQNVSPERAYVLAGGVLDSIARSQVTTDRNSRGDELERLLRQLLEKCGKDEAALLLNGMVSEATAEGLVRVSHLINAEELAHGRLAGSEKQPRRQLVNLSAMDELERRFACRAGELSGSRNVLAIPGNSMLMYLWDCFDRSAVDGYLATLLEDDSLNIVYLCRLSLGAWRTFDGAENEVVTGWSPVADRFNRYIDANAVQEQIDQVRMSKSFWAMDPSLQYTTAAVYLLVEQGFPDDDSMQAEISQERVEELLASWRENCAE